MANSDDDKRVQSGKTWQRRNRDVSRTLHFEESTEIYQSQACGQTGHGGVAGEKRKLPERTEDSGDDEESNKKQKIKKSLQDYMDKKFNECKETGHSQAYRQTSHPPTPQQNRHHISSSSLDREIDDSKANHPQNGHDTSSTPDTSSQLTAVGGKSPQSVVSLDSLVAQKSPDGGQQHNWKIDETALQSVFPNAAKQISSRPRNGKIYEAISDKETGIRERLKELSHPNSKLSIDIGLEMADGVYLLKLMNMTTPIDVVEKARNMAERGAMFLHIGEELLHRCRETIQSLLNESTPGTETGAVD